MKRLLLLQLIFLPLLLFGQCDLLPTSTTHEIVKHTYYTLSFSKKDEQAEWVAYLLTRSMITGKSERTENFRPDPSVPSGSAQLYDYKNSGYDRGHLCPAGDMTFSDQAMSETFYLSNMSPQVPAFNRGIWKNLESLVREWAEEDDSIYIVTGGILNEAKGIIGPDRVTVPSRFYKVIYDLTGVKKMIAFILPNEKGTGPLQSYVVTVRDVESQTCIDFFPCLPDSIQNRLESTSDISKWDFNITTTSSTGTSQQFNGTANTTNTTSGYRQCAAITKAGTRCKRQALPGSDYCWQHQK
ncbi:MAG: DNA/RNA non-specific endonuclease [Bacteroidales bacterium]